MSNGPRGSLTRLDKIKLNRKKSSSYSAPIPVVLTHDDVEPLLLTWNSFCESAGPEGINNAFSYLLVQHPEIYWEFFRNAPSVPLLDDTSNVAMKNEKLNRHNENIHKVLDNCLKFSITNDLGTVESTLRRLGAYHAEFQVTGMHLINFEPCLMWSLDMVDPSMNQHLKQIWQRIFEYIIRNMVIGINNYNDKVMQALSHKKIILKNPHWCSKCHFCGGSQSNELEVKKSYSGGSISDHK